MRRTRQRSGITAVLAMLYLSLFAVLAVGFYAATTTAMVVTHNDRRAAEASLAAESGMEFMRYQLAQVCVPHGTSQDQLFSLLVTQLTANLNGTANLQGHDIAVTGNVIRVPGGLGNTVSLATGGRFSATVENLGQGLQVTVRGYGADSSIARAVQMKYNLAQKASAIFDYGVASRGKITTSGSTSIIGATDPTKGSLLSTCLSDPTPVAVYGKTVSGDISITNASGSVAFGAGTSIGGSNSVSEIVKHIHKGVTAPEFPTIDTAAFVPYVTNTYAPGMTTLVNCRIPANTNPSFAGQVNIQGVLYVETPNKITFQGNANIQGLIVVQNNPTGTVSTNGLYFSGNVSAQGVDTLPESFGALRQMTGSFILAPNFGITFTGDFGTVSGSIISSKFAMSGNAKGTVRGSIVNLEDTPMAISGNGTITIASTGTTNYPSGVFFESRYVPLADTYEEVPAGAE